MPDSSYKAKVYRQQGGDKMVVKSGGEIKIETGATITNNGTQASAMTAAATAITITDAAGTPDYALSALTTSSPYGLATAAEAITLLYVIQNLQVQVAELRAALVGIKVIPS